ncbi:hypothetical protein CBM2626_B130090 [Cupriavidus taiwanensis]|nr:hypothetical protein CBM2626_B130090 [Cupriavidus taiwanensis]
MRRRVRRQGRLALVKYVMRAASANHCRAARKRAFRTARGMLRLRAATIIMAARILKAPQRWRPLRRLVSRTMSAIIGVDLCLQ